MQPLHPGASTLAAGVSWGAGLRLPQSVGNPLSACLLLAVLVLALPVATRAQSVTGLVFDANTGAAIAGAQVHVQASPDTHVVLTAADGRFSLPVDDVSGSSFMVSAALAYDPAATLNYQTGAASAAPGADIQIGLRPVPLLDNANYQPVTASGNCANCHSEQYQQWLTSNHAHAARNAWVRDLYSGDGTGSADGPSGQGYVFLNLHQPAATGLCATCHAPNERPSDPGGVKFNEVATASGLEGVTCTSCHQLHDINENVRAIHLLGNAEFRFPAAFGAGGTSLTHQYVWGPLDDVNFGQMRAMYAPVFSSSRMCASCHEYETPASGAPGQETYTEWLTSPAAEAGVQCQDCHMPAASTPGRLAAVGQAPMRPGSQRHDHSFPGVYSGRLGEPIALSLEARQQAGSVRVTVAVTNQVLGHSFPTGVDVRNAFVVIEAHLDGQPLAQIEGDTLPFWVDDDVEGKQPGDYAGMAGRGYAKLLEGRIDGHGPVLSPVPFIDAEALVSKTSIAAGDVDQGEYVFSLPELGPGAHFVDVRARVFYRRVWRAIAVAKNWVENEDGEPWERLLADSWIQVPVEPRADLIFHNGLE